MCGPVSFLRHHPSNTATCLQQQPTPSASEAHTSYLKSGKQTPFYLSCKSTDVWNASKCTQPSLGFRHSFSLDDLFGILIPSAFWADKLFFCSFRAASASLFQPMCHGQHTKWPHLPCPIHLRVFARQIWISIWKMLYLDILIGWLIFRLHSYPPFISWRKKGTLSRVVLQEKWSDTKALCDRGTLLFGPNFPSL